MVLGRDRNSLAMEEVGHNSDLWPSQNDVHFIVVRKYKLLETQPKVGSLTILN